MCNVGRPGADTDMGACILFLAGPGGLFLSSQTLFPDGGESSPFLRCPFFFIGL